MCRLAARIKEYRLAARISQAAMAERSGVSLATIARYVKLQQIKSLVVVS